MKLIFVVGPTASGKSELAMRLAEKYRGEILNCDSLQMYSNLKIGTAMPSESDMSRVPHHLFGFVKPPQVFTAGDYRKAALVKLNELSTKNVPYVFVVGGSGFYFSALEHGMFELGKVDEVTHQQVQSEAESEGGLEKLFIELKERDPEYAAKIGANDAYRLQRAVELLRFFKKTPTELRKSFKPETLPYSIEKLGVQVSREGLLKRVEKRVNKMLEQGLVAEVKSLLEAGLRSWPPLESVGYKEVIAFLEGEITESEMQKLIVQNTMRLAKRQVTWFKRDEQIRWLSNDGEHNRLELDGLAAMAEIDD